MVKAGFVAAAFVIAATSAQALSLASPDIKPGARIADEQTLSSFGCSGKNISPALNWSGAPKGTKSFAVMVYDSDAPGSEGFWHWALFNIPPDTMALAKNAGDPRGDASPKGAVQSQNDFGAPGYGGPCPPKGDKPHHYHFTLFALDVGKLDANENASATLVARNLHPHTLAKTELVGVWGR